MPPTRILHLSRQLAGPPSAAAVRGVEVRTFDGEKDIEVWLELRSQAFADQTPAVRPWTRADFTAEFLSKPWWSPQRLWLAEVESDRESLPGRAIGAVALALRGEGTTAVPAVHWLMVAPRWRRRGVGRLLMAVLEDACWQAGYRRVAIETHVSWSAAEAFYGSLGYADVEAGRPTPESPSPPSRAAR